MVAPGTSDPIASHPPRSLLFVPGHRPDMIAKVGRSNPDAVVIDLEDAVPVADKESARAATIDALGPLVTGGAGEPVVLVRVNPPGSPWFDDDVAAVAATAAAGIVLPKYDKVEDLAGSRAILERHGRRDAAVLVGVETVRGVADSRELLAAGVSAAYFGAEDFIADLGGRRTDAGNEVLYARSLVAMSGRLAGVAVIDQTVVAIHDDARFVDDAGVGLTLGYTGKICVHPKQVPLAHSVFSPSPAEVERAERVVAAAGQGAAAVDGEMVDEVHVRMALQVLARRRVDGPSTPDQGR